jgi:TatD DNase family protein
MRLVDSHAHLQADRFSADVDAVIWAARLAGLERILLPGWNGPSSRAALALVDRYPWLDAAVGVHPHDAAKVDLEEWSLIAGLAADPRVVAIGETGLDYDRVFSPIAAQSENLRRNLALALEAGKPAILHVRSAAGRGDAQDALVDELRAAGFGSATAAAAFGARPPGVIHSFSGSLDFARAVLDLGFAISISGLAFRRGEESTADVVALVPGDRLLVETDSPFLSAPGAPRSRNTPEWVHLTAAWVAERRGVTLDDLGDSLVAAYDRTFPRDGAGLIPAVGFAGGQVRRRRGGEAAGRRRGGADRGWSAS